MLNADSLLNVVTSYKTDICLCLSLILGYFLIKYLYTSSSSKPRQKPYETKPHFPHAKTLNDFNTLIKTKYDELNLTPFEILQLMKSKYIVPDINTYNNLLNACYIQKNFTSAEKLAETILEFGSRVQPDLSTYNILLKGVSCKLDTASSDDEKRFLISTADNFFEDISKNNFTPNDITLNTMLDVLIKGNEFKRAWDLFDIMKLKYNIEPDKYSYSTIIKALKYEVDSPKIDRVFCILDFLKTQTLTSNDEITFNCLIEVCLKLNMIDKAKMIYDEMNRLGVTPSKVTYAIMIRGYGQVFDYDNAKAIYDEMINKDIKPNEIVFGCLLNAAVRCARIDSVADIYKEMKDNEIEINIIIYTTLIKAYAKAKDLTKALEVYNTMLNDNKIKPNIVIHNAMLDACVECRDTNKMTGIYTNIKRKAIEDESNPLPDLITYSTVIKGYSRAKDMDNVFKLYSFLQSQETQFVLDEVVYNSILDGCVKTSNYEKGLEVYKDMQAHRIECSNVTYSILCKLYANNNENEKAFQVLSEMRSKGIKPGIIVYTCLIQSSFKNNNPTRAIGLFETLKNEGLKADYVLYNTVVNGCLFHSKWESACQYTLESFDKNVKMAYNIYRNCLEKLTAKYCNLAIDVKSDYAARILKKMKEKGLEVDDEISKKVSQMIYKNNYKMEEYGNSNGHQYNYRKFK